MLTKEQLIERRGYLGGSDMAVILGLSNYKTPMTLYLEKLGLVSSEEVETPQQEWGKLLEPVIRAKFESLSGFLVPEHNGAKHDKHSFIMGNLDGYNHEHNIVWEGKTSSAFLKDSWGDNNSDFIPAEYLVQIATYCSCVKADTAFLSVLIGGNDYRQYKYTRDHELEEIILSSANDFWNCLQNRIEPEPVSIDDLRIKYKQTDPSKMVKASTDVFKAYSSLGIVRNDIKELQKKEAEYQMEIMSYMAESECLVSDEGVPLATWKQNKKGTRVFLLKESK